MKKFQTMGELIAYMVAANAPNELKNAAIENIQAVEEVNQGGATAYLIIAESKAEARQIMQPVLRYIPHRNWACFFV